MPYTCDPALSWTPPVATGTPAPSATPVALPENPESEEPIVAGVIVIVVERPEGGTGAVEAAEVEAAGRDVGIGAEDVLGVVRADVAALATVDGGVEGDVVAPLRFAFLLTLPVLLARVLLFAEDAAVDGDLEPPATFDEEVLAGEDVVVDLEEGRPAAFVNEALAGLFEVELPVPDTPAPPPTPAADTPTFPTPFPELASAAAFTFSSRSFSAFGNISLNKFVWFCTNAGSNSMYSSSSGRLGFCFLAERGVVVVLVAAVVPGIDDTELAPERGGGVTVFPLVAVTAPGGGGIVGGGLIAALEGETFERTTIPGPGIPCGTCIGTYSG
jgi:hypothetical protein